MKIRQDQHSLYVRTGGYLFRPVYSQTTSIGYSHALKEGSKYQNGDEVKAHHIAGSQLAKVGDETWFSHGEYFNKGTTFPSENVWHPV